MVAPQQRKWDVAKCGHRQLKNFNYVAYHKREVKTLGIPLPWCPISPPNKDRPEISYRVYITPLYKTAQEASCVQEEATGPGGNTPTFSTYLKGDCLSGPNTNINTSHSVYTAQICQHNYRECADNVNFPILHRDTDKCSTSVGVGGTF